MVCFKTHDDNISVKVMEGNLDDFDDDIDDDLLRALPLDFPFDDEDSWDGQDAEAADKDAPASPAAAGGYNCLQQSCSFFV